MDKLPTQLRSRPDLTARRLSWFNRNHPDWLEIVVNLLKMTLGTQTYALDLSRVLGIYRNEAVEAVSEGPEAGLLRVDGALSTVVRLAALLGEPLQANSERVVVLVGTDPPIGLWVDSVSALPEAAPQLVPVPFLARSGAGLRYSAIALLKEGLIPLLEPDSLLAPGIPCAEAQPHPPLSERIEKRPASSGKLLVAPLLPSDWWVAFSLRQIEEVLVDQSVHVLTGGRSELLGLLSWRGAAVPVVDPGRLLGFGTSTEVESRLLVVRAPLAAPKRFVAFRVFAGVELIELPITSDCLPIPSTGLPMPVLGCYSTPGHKVVLLDLDRLV